MVPMPTLPPLNFHLFNGGNNSGRRNWSIRTEANTAGDMVIQVSDDAEEPGSSGNTQVLNLLKSGNVGIGTTNPGSKLDTQGASVAPGDNDIMRVSVDSSGDILQFGIVEASSYSWIRTAHPGEGFNDLALQPDGGDVGIGTTDPANKMHIYENVSQTNANLLIENDHATGDATLGLLRTGTQEWGIGIDADDESLKFASSANDVGTNTRMVIESGGDVGIGTASPDAKTHIVSTVDNESLLVENTNSGRTLIELKAGANLANIVGFRDASTGQIFFIQADANGTPTTRIATNQATGAIAFETGSQSEAMRIESGGDVGIGTTDPDAQLHVGGDGELEVGLSGTNASIVADESLTIDIDHDNSQTDRSFNVIHNAATTLFTVQEAGRASFTFGDGAVWKFGEETDLADDGTVALTTNWGDAGILTLTCSGNACYCAFAIRGSENTVTELWDAGGKCLNTDEQGSVVVGTATASTYEINNRSGSTLDISVEYMGR